MSTPAVLLFARLPQPGRVKTRLAATTGDAVAVGFYSACAEHVFAQVRALDVQRYVFVADAADADRVQAWVGPAFTVLPQRGHDLGERMKLAFKDVFRRGATAAVVTATDTPELSADHVRRALRALVEAPVVLGPSTDGGYYLLGVRSVHDWLFESMPWSTADVLGETRSRISARRIRHVELDPLADVDTEADLRAWLSRAGDETLGRSVRALLTE